MRNSQLLRRLIIGLIFGFLVVLVLLLFSDIRKVVEVVTNFKWCVLPAVLTFTLINYVLRGIKFHYYLRLVGAGSISIWESFRIFVAGFPLAVTPGKVGEALKGVWIHNKTGEPIAKGVSVVVAERISDGLAVLALSFLGVISYPQYWPIFLSILLILTIIIVISQVRPIALKWINWSSRLPIINRFSEGILEFYEGSYKLFQPTPVFLAVGLGVVSWLGEGIGFYFVLRGLGVDPSTEVLFLAIFILAFSTIVGAVSTLPGGLGASEASITAMLTLLVGLNLDISASATILIRFATLWFGVGLGLITWIFSKDLIQANQVHAEIQGIENA